MTKPFVRKPLDHAGHFEARFGATYFLTICCQKRDLNQLCRKGIADNIFDTVARYDRLNHWYAMVVLLMPDHLHALISCGADISLSDLIRNFKRATTKFAGVRWQRNFFDHRIRRDESLDAKASYIRENPVRAGLIADPDDWPYVLDRNALEKMAVR